ncbi:M42 family metallopeptidase [Halomarina oriensis]|uniref:M20/M25/M40 family metallo-hydrolase n=1 Tax=Halomarina oriensis TaxID=671145 RepID=A0A6B0GU96_9EURY|nr:M42 family metallopeptidase [Halomarina oriensis]MWG36967.1 M20/M25/M40 family metallo-hydrolase [Halomarina oriensis]
MTRELPFDFELLRDLTAACGPVGYEDDVRTIVREELEASTDEVTSDAMGNVVGTVHGESDYSVVVAAHIDEWGWMVERITDDGFLELNMLGGTNPLTARSQRVTVRTRRGEHLTGIIGAVPPHMLGDDELDKRPTDPRQAVWDVEDVYVELGLDAAAVRDRVEPGDVVTLAQETIVMGDHVTGKAFDNRALVFAMLEAARRIEDPAVTVHFAATVQEEVGLRGAEALAVDLDPDLALALDIAIANDQPYFDDDPIVRAGAGTAIKVKDHTSLTNPKVTDRLRDLAEDRDIPHQLEIYSSGGTDAGAFQTANGATPVGAVLLPTRNIHSDTASAHVDDIAATTDLLTAFLETETGDDYVL